LCANAAPRSKPEAHDSGIRVRGDTKNSRGGREQSYRENEGRAHPRRVGFARLDCEKEASLLSGLLGGAAAELRSAEAVRELNRGLLRYSYGAPLSWDRLLPHSLAATKALRSRGFNPGIHPNRMRLKAFLTPSTQGTIRTKRK